MSVEKERRDERQVVKQVQRKGETEGETKKDRQPDVLTLHTLSSVQWVQCEKLLMLIHVLSLSSVVQSLFYIFLPYSTYVLHLL